jgi:4-amino-4-deoxy-L-arabinose transferase-like glycosyltransferase
MPSRYTSAAFLGLSVLALFGLAWQVGGRLAGEIGAVLYTLNPVLLLNGRRAVMEGSMLGFGLLTVFLAAVMAGKIAREQRVSPFWWVGLTLPGD